MACLTTAAHIFLFFFVVEFILCLFWVVKKANIDERAMVLQIILCGVLVPVNCPLYQCLLSRKENGKMPIKLSESLSINLYYPCLLVPVLHACIEFSFLFLSYNNFFSWRLCHLQPAYQKQTNCFCPWHNFSYQ